MSACPSVCTPRVSVLVPTYNYARFLPEAIESVLAQGFRDFELLISDDGSTDDSAAVIQHYVERDARVRAHFRDTNIGMVANWNGCLRQARGEYVKFLFGDDVLTSPVSLGRLVAQLDAAPGAQLAASARLLLDARSRVTGLADELRVGEHDGPRLIAHCLRKRSNLIGEPSAVMFRRDCVSEGFDPSLRQIVDLEFWFRLLLRGSLVYTREPLCGFRQHSRQQTVVNHRSSAPHWEMLDLFHRWEQQPRVCAHFRPGSFAHHRLLWCHVHYARKARVSDPDFQLAIDRLARRIPLPWGWVSWAMHRLLRPAENARRKLRSLRQRLGSSWPAAFTNAKDPAVFLATLRPPFSSGRCRSIAYRGSSD